MLKTPLLSALVCISTACVIGSPPGFSSGDSWSIPLVGPLEDGAIVVPVKVNGKGPYLFMIDPDSSVSSIDGLLASDLDLYTVQGDRYEVDESDTQRVVRFAEVMDFELGNLRVRNKTVRLHRAGTYWFGGRMLRGFLGRDILADSLILAIDRDRGMMYMGTQGHLDPPMNATVVKARRDYGKLIVTAKLNEQHSVDLGFDLGGPFTLLWEETMDKAKLPRVRIRTTLADEYGTKREVNTGAMVAKLSAGDASVDGLMVLPFLDKRMRRRQLDGSLGNNFLSRFNITVNWHKKKIWLEPRLRDHGELANDRLRRWGPWLDKCKTPACVVITLNRPEPSPTRIPTSAEGEPLPPVEQPEPEPIAPVAATSISFTREGWTRDREYDVTVEALNTDGSTIGLPLLRVTFQQGAETVVATDGMTPYLGASSFRVVDMSPFPRSCDAGSGTIKCVWQIQRAR